MSKYTFVVLTNATAGKDEEFNEWYNKRHLPDVLAIPGFTAAQRFRLSDTQPKGRGVSAWRYLALYEIETDDLKGTLDALAARAGTSAMVMSDALDMKSIGAYIFSPIGERLTAQQAARK
jgi:hypothetical protein